MSRYNLYTMKMSGMVYTGGKSLQDGLEDV